MVQHKKKSFFQFVSDIVNFDLLDFFRRKKNEPLKKVVSLEETDFVFKVNDEAGSSLYDDLVSSHDKKETVELKAEKEKELSAVSQKKDTLTKNNKTDDSKDIDFEPEEPSFKDISFDDNEFSDGDLLESNDSDSWMSDLDVKDTSFSDDSFFSSDDSKQEFVNNEESLQRDNINRSSHVTNQEVKLDKDSQPISILKSDTSEVKQQIADNPFETNSAIKNKVLDRFEDQVFVNFVSELSKESLVKEGSLLDKLDAQVLKQHLDISSNQKKKTDHFISKKYTRTKKGSSIIIE